MHKFCVLLVIFFGYIEISMSKTCDVLDYGAKGDSTNTDIDETNGPLEVIPKSHNFLQNPIKIDYAKKIFSTIYPSKFNSDNLYFTINNESLKSRKIVGHKGSLAIFNTRCLHKASILKNGLRKVIWAYF